MDRINWSEVSTGYGPRFLKLGPLNDNDGLKALEKEILENSSKALKDFINYEYSERYCIEGDPGHQGYHGLKGIIQDEFIYTGKPEFSITSTKYIPEEKGDIYYIWTEIKAETPKIGRIKTSTFKPAQIWINGELTNDNSVSLRPGINTVLLKYKGAGRGYFVIESENAPEDWVQSYPLSMTWYNKTGVYKYDIFPERQVEGKYRFTSAPGLKELIVTAYGKVTVQIHWRNRIRLYRSCDIKAGKSGRIGVTD